MNILIVFVAGVAVGLAVDKLYRSFAGKVEVSDDDITSSEAGTPNKVASKNIARATNKETPENDLIDDLSQLKGVGPKLASALDEIGIYNFEQLSSTSVDTLLEKLRKTGGRFTKASILLIVERAKLAAQE